MLLNHALEKKGTVEIAPTWGGYDQHASLNNANSQHFARTKRKRGFAGDISTVVGVNVFLC